MTEQQLRVILGGLPREIRRMVDSQVRASIGSQLASTRTVAAAAQRASVTAGSSSHAGLANLAFADAGHTGFMSLDTDQSAAGKKTLAPALTGSSGTMLGLALTPTVNQSATAGYTGFDIQVTETALGSGLNFPVRVRIGSQEVFCLNSGLNMGLGTSAPGAKIEAVSDNPSDTIYNDIGIRAYDDVASGPAFVTRRARGDEGTPAAVNADDEIGSFYAYGHNGTSFVGAGYVTVAPETNFSGASRDARMSFGTSGSGALGVRATLTSLGNLIVGAATAAGTSAQSALMLCNGVAPSSSPANAAQLYAKDLSASSELYCRDEAGNETLLSPHGFVLYDPDPSQEAPWAYHSVNYYTGWEVNADIFGALREIERLSGKTFLHMRRLPPGQRENWAGNEQKKVREREAEIRGWEAREARGITQGKRPSAYTPKEPPAWLAARM